MFLKIFFFFGLESHFFLNFNKKILNFLEIKNFKNFFNNKISYFELGLNGVLPLFNFNFVKNIIFFGFYLKNYLFYMSFFVRKSYFYPDIPKNYQITQDVSILKFGILLIYNNYINFPYYKFINIIKIHIEEDSSKIIYLKNYSKVDFNRSNFFLLEIVSFYNLSNFYEIYIYLNNLKKFIFFYKKKNINNILRFDLNISSKYFYYEFLLFKIEIKNLDSFFILKNVILFEIKRQIFNLYFLNFYNETRFYDLKNNFTYFIRNKENKIDYKYFIEPEKNFLFFNKNFFLNTLKFKILLFYYIKINFIFNFKNFFFFKFFIFYLLIFFFKLNKKLKIILFLKTNFFLFKNISFVYLIIIFKLYLFNFFSLNFSKKIFFLFFKKKIKIINYLFLILIKNNLIKNYKFFYLLNYILLFNLKIIHNIFFNKKILNFFLYYIIKFDIKNLNFLKMKILK
ncbi:hypothetical protein NDNC_0180 [Candidatus Nasuia deltocephalinicola]|nr:hypothetical protein NDNC_0180 [Candidatus Nasuia deltocephalinicola]